MAGLPVPRRLDAGDPAALAAVRELLAEAERFDGAPPVSDQALLSAAQGRRALVAFGDPMVAVGVLGEGELDLVVRPGGRGRGVGAAALGELLRIARDEDRGAGAAAGPQELRAWAHGENPAAHALLAGAGFEPVRSLLRLALDPARLPAAIDAARPMPEGVRTVAYDPANPAHAADWVRVNAAAFADHPEQGAVTPADFEALTRENWFDPQDLRLAYASDPAGGLAGYTWIKTVRGEHGVETELYVLGVDPAWHGRGLGAALTGETLRRMREHAPDRITLYVDGGNEQARSIYDRAGFEVDQRSTQWMRQSSL